jgi:hypothetical protein
VAIFTRSLPHQINVTGVPCSTTINNALVQFQGVLDQSTLIQHDTGGQQLLAAHTTLLVIKSIADQLNQEGAGQVVNVSGTNYQVNQVVYLDDGQIATLLLSLAGV